MKKLLTFILFTMALIIITCFYLWMNLHDHVTSITYVPHTEWSEPQAVPSMHSQTYDAKADRQNRLHLVWLESTSNHHFQVQYTVLQSDGKPLFPVKTILTHPQIQDLTLSLSEDRIQLFWIGEGATDKDDLFWSEFDLSGNLLDQKTLLANESILANDLDVIDTMQGDHLLVWTDHGKEGRVLKTLRVSPTGRTTHSTQITASADTILTPQMTKDETGQIHLIWRKETSPEQYQLLYQPLSEKGFLQGSPSLIDHGPLGLAAISARAGQVYLVWEKANPNFVHSQNLYGARVSWKESQGLITPIPLSKPDSSNFTPVLGWDDANQLRLVYGKQKGDYTSLVSQSYGTDFTETIGMTRWIYPQPMTIAHLQLTSDPDHRLYVTCLESRLGNQHTLHYLNSFQTQKTSPWQIIGLNSRDLRDSLQKSLVYILFGPVLNLFVFTFYFISVVTIVFSSFFLATVRNRFENTRREALANHFYLNLGILCVIQIILIWQFINLLQFDWPMRLFQDHFWIVYGLSTLAIFLYSFLHRVHKTEVMYASILCFGWAYWVWIIQLTLYMANLNFIVPPMI